MLTRRSVTTLLQTAGLLAALSPLTRRAWAQPTQQAVAFVRSITEQLAAIVNSEASPQDKRRRLQQVVDTAANIDDIAQFCLGRFWHVATPEQQRQYLTLFSDLLVTKIAGHLGEYRGVRVTMGPPRATEDSEIVITTVERPNTPGYQVDWVVSTATGRPKIVDILTEGTSLRLTQSNDFVAYLARHQYNIHELIEAMRQIVVQSG